MLKVLQNKVGNKLFTEILYFQNTFFEDILLMLWIYSDIFFHMLKWSQSKTLKEFIAETYF